MKKLRLILIVALALSTIVSSSFALGLIRVKAVASTAVDPHQALVDICSSPPPSVQLQVQVQQEDPVPCEGGSANIGLGLAPETLAFSWGVDCLHLVPAGGTDNCATPLIASSVALTFAFENPNFPTTGPLAVTVSINGVPITSVPGNAFSRGTVPFGALDGVIPASGIITPLGTTRGVFSIFIYAGLGTGSTSMQTITSPPGVATTCVLPNALPAAPDGVFPPHCITSDDTNFLEVTIVGGQDVSFTGITALVRFPI